MTKQGRLNRVINIEEASDRIDCRFLTDNQLRRIVAKENPLKVVDFDEDGNPVYELDEPAPHG